MTLTFGLFFLISETEINRGRSYTESKAKNYQNLHLMIQKAVVSQQPPISNRKKKH
jgi:hypothetical protein